MIKSTSKNRRTAPEQLIETYDAVIKSCGVSTCIDEAAPHYDLQQKLARAWGSNVIAVMLFIGENWLRGQKDWFPVAVEKPQFEPGHCHYWMLFHPKRRVLCDFTIDFFFGGEVDYDPDVQEARLQAVLADPTLETRLAAGMHNFGMKAPVHMLLALFTEALHAGMQHKPELLFAEPTK